LMLESALEFATLLDRWTGRALPWDALRSRPFTYLVLTQSMVTADVLSAAYERLEREYEPADVPGYVGTRPPRLSEPVDVGGLNCAFDREAVAAAVRTAEVALDPALLRRQLRRALHARPEIAVRYGHRVREAERSHDGFVVRGTHVDDEPWESRAPVVVNCLWDRRLAIDAHLGLVSDRPWIYRLKYRVLGRLPATLADLPSLTLVLGRFGDIVVHPTRPTYVSWYPACLAGWHDGLEPPADWAVPCAGPDDRPSAYARARAAIDGLAHIVPALADFEVEAIDAGVIAAWGETDIDDPASGLHERHAIGPRAHDGWVSIDTGKLTTAPRFARQLVELVGRPA
jgi:hypothetical protein